MLRALPTQLLAGILALAVPAAPALCKGSQAPEADAPPACHAHAQPATDAQSDSAVPEPDPSCCAACYAFVRADAPSVGPPLATGLATLPPVLTPPAGTAYARAATHPPPDRLASPYLQHSPPLLS